MGSPHASRCVTVVSAACSVDHLLSYESMLKAAGTTAEKPHLCHVQAVLCEDKLACHMGGQNKQKGLGRDIAYSKDMNVLMCQLGFPLF